MSYILLVFGFIDLLTGLTLWQTPWFPGSWLHLLGWTVLIKGLYSVGMNAFGRFYFDWAGWIDLIAAGSLLMGWAIPLFWAAPVFKGCWTLLTVYAKVH